MMVSRILMLGLAAVCLALVANPSALAHPPEEHTAAPVAADQPAAVTETATTDQQVSGAASDAFLPDETLPHDHDAAAAHQHGPVAAVPHHNEAAQHEPGAEAPDGHGAEGGHSHWGDNGANTPLEKAIEGLGVYHPLLVHFPIALILAAALAQAFNLAGMRVSNADTVRFLVWAGAVGGLAAGLLGWAHAGPMASDEAGIMLAHRWIGSSLTLGLFGVVAAVEWHRKSSSSGSALVLNLSLFTAAAAVAINGFLGGSLAHGGVTHLMEM